MKHISPEKCLSGEFNNARVEIQRDIFAFGLKIAHINVLHNLNPFTKTYCKIKILISEMQKAALYICAGRGENSGKENFYIVWRLKTFI